MYNSINNLPKVSWRDYLQISAPDMPNYLLALAQKYGSFFEVKSKFPRSFLVAHPDAIEHVLKKNMDNYSKDFHEYHRLGELLGKGLLTSMGPDWLERRRAIQALFHKQMLEKLADLTLIATNDLLQRWEWYVKHAQPLNIVPEMLGLVLQISLRFLFSEDISHEDAVKLTDTFTSAQRCMLTALTLNPRIPTPANWRFHLLRRTIVKFAKKILDKRRALPESAWPQDLLTILLQMGLSDAAIFDELITFMATGHETTGNALNWAMYSLAKHPDAMRSFHHEMATVLNGRAPTHDDIAALPYSKMIVQETLRLYPTIWNFARRAEADDELLGHAIPAQSNLIICPYVMHRLPEFWEDANSFIPERFADQKLPAQQRGIYIPFGVGPHICIAHTFSFLKLQLILTTVLQRFRFELLPESENVGFEALISLRPKKPIRFRVRES